ncbi:MAG: hypothetical protein BroJett006_20410 [Betaproteobacteria bacterium]|nr:MAG: hypothetical protein BroJett006_20410 [Betaproteobacteria bacterium]
MDAYRSTEALRLLPHRPFEALIANKGRVTCGALEALCRMRRPSEEIAFMHKCGGRPVHCGTGSLGVLFDAHTATVQCDETAIST